MPATNVANTLIFLVATVISSVKQYPTTVEIPTTKTTMGTTTYAPTTTVSEAPIATAHAPRATQAVGAVLAGVAGLMALM